MEDNNISFIEDITVNDKPITIKEEAPIEQIPQQTTNQVISNTVIQSDEFIKELPKWDINPPLEINRGEK